MLNRPGPCCRYLTIVSFNHGPPGTFAICPVCRWEDDYINAEGLLSGANHATIDSVRATFEAWRDAGMPEDDGRRRPRHDEIPRTADSAILPIGYSPRRREIGHSVRFRGLRALVAHRQRWTEWDWSRTIHGRGVAGRKDEY